MPEPADAAHRFGGFVEVGAAAGPAVNASLVIDLPQRLVAAHSGADHAVPPPR